MGIGSDLNNSSIPVPVSIANGGTGAASASAAFTALGGLTANQLSVYASGTPYALTNAAALLTFGTTSPSLTISAAGTYLIIARSKLDYSLATFAAVRTTTIKLRRTNNTAADLTNGSVMASTLLSVSALTNTFVDQCWQAIYTTTNANDIIQLFGSIDTAPGAGALNASEASIIAIRLQQ